MEVRRFGVEQNEVTSFDLLKKKLRLVFPHLNGQEFSIGWKGLCLLIQSFIS